MNSFKPAIFVFLLFAALGGLFFLFVEIFQKELPSAPLSSESVPVFEDQAPPAEDFSLSQGIERPWFLEGTFFSDVEIEEGTQEGIEVVIQMAESRNSVRLAWDESKFRVFEVVLFNGDNIEKREYDNILAWSISSLREFPEGSPHITREDVGDFLHSGYVIGEGKAGFNSIEIPKEFQPFALEPGTTYYLQLMGFWFDDSDVLVNKTFTFTDSCLPPNCN